MSELLLSMLLFMGLIFVLMTLFGLIYELYLNYSQWQIFYKNIVNESIYTQGLANWDKVD